MRTISWRSKTCRQHRCYQTLLTSSTCCHESNIVVMCCCCDESRQKIQFYLQVHSQSCGYKCNWFGVTAAISWSTVLIIQRLEAVSSERDSWTVVWPCEDLDFSVALGVWMQFVEGGVWSILWAPAARSKYLLQCSMWSRSGPKPAVRPCDSPGQSSGPAPSLHVVGVVRQVVLQSVG